MHYSVGGHKATLQLEIAIPEVQMRKLRFRRAGLQAAETGRNLAEVRSAHRGGSLKRSVCVLQGN